MLIELDEASVADVDTLENLGQLYKHDFSEFASGDVGPYGKFSEVGFRHVFAKPVRHVFLIRVDGQIAGFAAMSYGDSYRDRDEDVWYMDEFFVMRKYRGQGVGERVATQLFDRFTGTWEVAQLGSNIAAQAFWRRIIGRYTNDSFEEIEFDDDRWVGPVQYLSSRLDS